jgi:hypothetical protein
LNHVDPAVSSGSSPGKRTRPDFLFSSDAFPATIYLLTPLSRRAHAWIADQIPDDALWFGGGVVVEHRFADAILRGIAQSGLAVSR